MSKINNMLESLYSGVERTIYIVSYPVVKPLDWLANGWLKGQNAEREGYIKFLEDAMAAQRSALNEYIVQCNKLTERLEKFEKHGESLTLHHKQWLEGELVRVTKIVREVAERNESLNNDNAKLLFAGNAVAELISVNKPKSRLTKKDKHIKSVIDQWNDAARLWK
jgi:uncharacterized coiled-coil protein SlyX